MTRAEASILHVDLDAFFASVEQLLEPALRGRPVIVGGLGPRGVVSAASYEARAFGVHSAMPMARARRLCPQAEYRSPRFDAYSAKSREVMAILGSYTPLVEQLSVDEAFLDVAGARRRGAGAELAAEIRAQVHAETGLVASVGVATTKFLAKVASDLAKPDGLLVVEPGTEAAFLEPLPVSRLWGVGPATRAKLERIGIATIGDVARTPESALTAAVGNAAGRHLHALARNRDDRAVESARQAKSIGAEETFPTDVHERTVLDRELLRLSDKVASRLRHAGLRGRTVTCKVRFADFETVTRARTLTRPTAVSTELAAAARELSAPLDVGRGVRLVGISVSQLAGRVEEQGVLDLGDAAVVDAFERRADIERAVDVVRARFGERAVGPATLVSWQATGQEDPR